MFACLASHEAANALAAIGRARTAADGVVVVVNKLSKSTAPSKSLARGLSRPFSSGPPPQPPLASASQHKIKRKSKSADLVVQRNPDLADFKVKRKIREVDLEQKHKSALIDVRSLYQVELESLRLSVISVDKELFAALGDAKATDFWQKKRDELVNQQRTLNSKLAEEQRALLSAQEEEQRALRSAQQEEQLARFFQQSPVTRAADFKELTIDGHTMLVAACIPDSDIEGPMYLPPEAFKMIRSFVKVPKPNQPLVLVGPPKCSKSAVLNHVIPSIVAQHSTDLEPIFVRFDFMLTEPPAEAIKSFIAVLLQVGDTFKLNLDQEKMRFREDPARSSYISDIVYQLALQFEQKQRKRLWLLLDECQAPIVSSATNADAVHFATILKFLIGKLGTHARFVMTGSSMVSFLNTVRNVPANGYHLFTSCEFVELGQAAPSERWEHTMTTSLIAASKNSLTPTPVELLASIKKRSDYLNVRPAIIRQILLKLEYDPKEAEQSLSKATQAAVDKMRNESKPDLIRALKELRSQPLFLGNLVHLSRGTHRASELFGGGKHDSLLTQFAAHLCGVESFEPDQRYQLLPPYAHLCDLHLELSDDGLRGSLVVLPDATNDLDEYTMHTLKVFHESKRLWYKEDITEFNHIAVTFFLGEGIGKRGADGTLLPLTAMFDDPNMDLLLQQQKNSYVKRFAEWKQDPVAYALKHPVAPEMASCIRHFSVHEVTAGGTSAEQLARYGLKSSQVRKFVEIIADCMRKFKHLEYRLGPDGFWMLNESRRTENKSMEAGKRDNWNLPRPSAPTTGNRTPIL